MLLERMGWSDETEMMAKILAYLKADWTKADKLPDWRDLLPGKYRSAANYQYAPKQTDAEVNALAESMQKALQ